MLYRFLADLLVVIHLLFILFALFGGLLVLRYRWMLYIHLPAAAWGVLVELMHWICPLTKIENNLRNLAGDSGYADSFVEQYLIPVIYPQSLTFDMQLYLGAMVLAINLIIYSVVIVKHRNKCR